MRTFVKMFIKLAVYYLKKKNIITQLAMFDLLLHFDRRSKSNIASCVIMKFVSNNMRTSKLISSFL